MPPYPEADGRSELGALVDGNGPREVGLEELLVPSADHLRVVDHDVDLVRVVPRLRVHVRAADDRYRSIDRRVFRVARSRAIPDDGVHAIERVVAGAEHLAWPLD